MFKYWVVLIERLSYPSAHTRLPFYEQKLPPSRLQLDSADQLVNRPRLPPL